MENDIKKVAVVGAGVMGSGIALCSVLSGYETVLFDINREAAAKGFSEIKKELEKLLAKEKISKVQFDKSLSLLNLSHNSEDLIADLIIEAVLEKLEIKRQLFVMLEKQNPDTTILATNTSSIPITQIARGMNRPGNIVGIHFFNPARIMKLVEIISGSETSDSVSRKAYEWAVSLDKTAVYTKDSPGFIVNRVARHYYVEGLKLLEENIASMESIDRLCESSGFKLGPFRLMDLIGVDTNFSVTSSMFEQFHFDPKFRPSRIQKQKVDAGHWGKKTGEGFYKYEN